MVSVSPTDISSAIRSTGPYGLSVRAACTAAWTCFRAFSYSGPQSAAFQITSVAHINEEYVTSQIQRSSVGIVPLWVVAGARCYNLPFVLERTT